ncbi:bifunctional UDP-N-acetylglucosamine pyrophosphorylase/glucosamine-1-phosphate N-acetyltransferase [Microbacterium halimionae]|uniref:Bifunctional protein GlmU n=2 Tax=Microbacterium halimionae TaxID=1526413 RepID=A0A7W3PL53_9MICO|nr:bifunctional UDP-N-acetylglucosamine pyrophosphorylase/glucosamine-1-phosphate N-acetyltransferase [Microbacterium halimionae]NII95834.1 bifunctional UDP-N-acetylglucosamine pyrophosphorylase/glucosamine-1-phosphate N-acetyltransferase [Microbacterium halimionae]
MKSRLPKVLHEIGGRSLVGHVLDSARSLNPTHVVVVVRHERDLVESEIRTVDPHVAVVDQDDVPGTGRAVQLAMDALSDFEGDVLVLSGDVPLLDADTIALLVSAHRASTAAVTLLSALMDEPYGYGRIIRSAHGSVERIVEQKDATSDETAIDEINAGVYVFRSLELQKRIGQIGSANAQGERYLTDMVSLLRADGLTAEATVAPDASIVLGVNDRVQLSEAARTLNARTVTKWQREGVTVLDTATTWIDVKAELAPDVTLLPNTFILGATTVAAGATIGPDTTLRDCEIAEDAKITRTDATLAVVGKRVNIGPFAFLRPGTVVHADGKVGTFVETKNSTIGAGSKVPHLSYVGDTTIGAHVNLGAGAVTANYDDLTKHRTEIGDEVHTGSHNVFVAPVKIGDGAKTGAGAVIRKDVPAGALALSVAPQRNITGWVETNRPGTGAADAAAASRAAQETGNGTQKEDS